MTDKKSREELALNIDEARWQWLKPLLERGALITVAATLDLAAVGECIATDDSMTISAWIAAARVGKPTAEQIAAWDKEPEKKFLMLIISPYVLIQEMGTIN